MLEDEGPVEIASNSCPIVQNLYVEDPSLKYIFLSQFITSILALLFLVILILVLCAWRAFSGNIRILIINLCLALVAANIGVLVSSVYHLHVFALRPSGSRCYWLTFSYDDCFSKFRIAQNSYKRKLVDNEKFIKNRKKLENSSKIEKFVKKIEKFDKNRKIC